MMNLVIDKFVAVLTEPPEPTLSPSSLGVKRPSGAGDIPAIVISLAIEDSKGNGIGRLVRAGDTVVQNTAVIEVSPTPEAFSTDLRSLRLWPLPLKKNPSSADQKFTSEDVQVRNVTDPTHPIEYQLNNEPTHKEEYALDVPTARIIFGEAQTGGEKLEVVHWTITWRDEILGDRYSGAMVMDIWANSFNEAESVSRRLQAKLRSNRLALRRRGFLKFQPTNLGPVENLLHNPPVGSPFPVWKQKLGYSFIFEAEEGGEVSSGIHIRRIDIEMNEHIAESFSVSDKQK